MFKTLRQTWTIVGSLQIMYRCYSFFFLLLHFRRKYFWKSVAQRFFHFKNEFLGKQNKLKCKIRNIQQKNWGDHIHRRVGKCLYTSLLWCLINCKQGERISIRDKRNFSGHCIIKIAFRFSIFHIFFLITIAAEVSSYVILLEHLP